MTHKSCVTKWIGAQLMYSGLKELLMLSGHKPHWLQMQSCGIIKKQYYCKLWVFEAKALSIHPLSIRAYDSTHRGPVIAHFTLNTWEI